MLGPNTILQGRYRIIRQLGHGGMGAVYEAMNERVSSIVALKETFAETEAQREAFEQEAKRLANLEHDAFPRVMDHFFEGEGQYLVMELVRGNDLAELLKLRESPFSPARVLEWADQLLDALEELHSYPIIHRDIKPSNLKLTRKGKIKLLDFGIAKGAAGQMTTLKTDQSGGGYTPHYAPLEQTLRSSGYWSETLSILNTEAVERIRLKSTDPRSDLYALGATLYHLMTGVVPPDAPTRALTVWTGRPDRLRPAHELNPQVPPEVSAALMRAMALERDDRPASAAQLRQILREAVNQPLSVPPTDLSAEIEEQARQRREAQARRRAEEAQEARQRAEAEAQEKREEEEAARRAEEEARRREAEERQRQEEEDRKRKAEQAEATRRAEEEQRRLRQAEKRRLAEAEAARLAAEEQQRVEAERRPKEAEEKQRRKAAEAARVSAEVERIRLEIARGQEERRAVLEAEEVEPQRAAENNVPTHTEPPGKQTPPLDPSPVKTIPASGLATPRYGGHATPDAARPVPPRQGMRAQRLLIGLIIAFVAVMAFVAVRLWMRQTPDDERRAANQDSTQVGTPPGDQKTGSASPVAAPQPPPGMVYVSGGEFMMGRDEKDGGDVYERPAHKVTVKPFFIDLYEVTNEEYAKFVRETGRPRPPAWTGGSYPPDAARKPVTGVTWDEARAYAGWMGKRLPTEEEWEFTARGANGLLYPWGNEWQDGYANANGASKGIANVGEFMGRSPFGAFDMIGNVWEWTESRLTAYPGGKLPNRNHGDVRVIRGGSYNEDASQATTTYRGYLKGRGDKTGFRCVKDIGNSATAPE